MKALSQKARIYILVTILAGAIFLGKNLLHFETQDAWTTLAVSVLASLSLIFKVEGATGRSHYNISFLIYAFTYVLMGVEAAMLVILLSNLVEWVWRKYPWYIQSFNIASYIIALQTAELIYVWINPEGKMFDLSEILGVLVAIGVFTLANHLMVGFVIWAARGENFAKSGILGALPLMIDFTMLGMGAASALIWRLSPFASLLTILPLYLLYNTLRVPALERQSETDPKTGLFNARYFERAMQSELSRANRFDRPLTIVMADLDLLRNINNTYGHLAGDQVLIGIANILKESVREYDIVSRFGGEEYAILIPEMTPEDAYPRLEAIRETIEKTEFNVPTSVTPIKATMSFGIAGRDGFNQTAGDIIHNADSALYHAKLKGRNRTFIYQNEIYKTLFGNSQEMTREMKEASLEARLSMSETPFQPNKLREAAESSLVEKQAQEPAREQQGQARPKWLLKAYLATLTLVALALFGLFYFPITNFDWSGLAIFALAVVLTEWLSIDIYVRDTSISTSAGPILAGTLLFGPVGAVVLSASFALVAMIKHRSPFSRLIFNFSNQMIAGMLYTGLIVLSGYSFADSQAVPNLAMSLLAAGIVYISTTILIALAMDLDLGLPVKQVWKEKFSWLAPYYGTMGLIAYALIFSYQTAGLIGIFVTLVPLLLLRWSQKQYIDRTRAMVNELKEKNIVLDKSAWEISLLNEGLLEALAEVIDLRDPYVLGHSRQVSYYAVLIARKLGLPEQQIELIRKAGLLHDIGKLGIPEVILSKPGALSKEEYELVKEHTTLGAYILEKSHSLRNLIPIVQHHHEHFNGNGYPDRLSGQDIPLEARIVGVSDAIEAMASDRPYRRGLRPEEILRELQENAGSQFDPLVVSAFIDIVQAEGEHLVVNSSRKPGLLAAQPVTGIPRPLAILDRRAI